MRGFILVTIIGALALSAINVEAFSLHPLQALKSFNAIKPATQTDTSSELATVMKDCIFAFQKLMPCGGAGFPVLAPYTMDYQELNYTSKYYSLKGFVSAVQVTGLNNFQLLKLNYSNDYISYDMYLPSIQLLGEFNVTMRANMLGFWVSDIAAGLANIKLNGLRFVGSYKIAQNSNNYVEVSDYKLQTLIESVQVNGWNNKYDALVNNFRDQMAGELSKIVVQETQGLVQNLVNEYYVPMLNEIYNTISMQQLIGYMMEAAIEFQNAC